MPRPVPLESRLTADELAAHQAFVATLGQNPIWTTYNTPTAEAAE